MRLIAFSDGEETEVTIERDGERISAYVGDDHFEFEVSRPEPGTYIIRDGSKIIEASAGYEGDGDAVTVTMEGETSVIEIVDPKRLRGSRELGRDAKGVAEVRTRMPGKVVRLLVSEGDSVADEQGVVIVEAMKMQNEIKSPRKGRVRRILVSPGDTANAGDLLLVID